MLKMAGQTSQEISPDFSNPEPREVTGLEVMGLVVKHPSGRDILLEWDQKSSRFRIAELSSFNFGESV